MVEFREDEETFIRYARVARIATVGPGASPHVVPVCPLLEGGKIYVASEDNRKVANVRTNPKVALSFDDYVEDWDGLRALTVFGEVARLLERGPEFIRLQRLFYEKFPQYPIQADGVVEGEAVILEIEIARVVGEI